MSVVRSCNEWDPLEEMVIGNPLPARFPTPDLSTRLAEFPDRLLGDIPFGLSQAASSRNRVGSGQIRLHKRGITVKQPETLPEILKQWGVIYSPPMENTAQHDADYLRKSVGSVWIDMNLFSISPNLVVDRDQTALIKLVEKYGVDVLPLKLRHSRMMGGGCPCVTLDIRKKGALECYFE